LPAHQETPAGEGALLPNGIHATGNGALFWTEARVALLLDLQAQNYSGRRIGAELGITRNAAMGKLARMGLTCTSKKPGRRSIRPRAASTNGRGTVQRVEAAKVRANFAFPAPKALPPKATPQPTVTPIPARPPDEASTSAQPTPATACSILDLTNETCRWPCGGVMGPPTLFCGTPGADLAAGMPYCGLHARLAYTPARGRL
jgi:GcrA cell cycle regulator